MGLTPIFSTCVVSMKQRTTLADLPTTATLTTAKSSVTFSMIETEYLGTSKTFCERISVISIHTLQNHHFWRYVEYLGDTGGETKNDQFRFLCCFCGFNFQHPAHHPTESSHREYKCIFQSCWKNWAKRSASNTWVSETI